MKFAAFIALALAAAAVSVHADADADAGSTSALLEPAGNGTASDRITPASFPTPFFLVPIGGSKCTSYSKADVTSYRLTFEQSTGCFKFAANAVCDPAFGNKCCFATGKQPQALQRLILETPAGSACALQNQGSLGVRYAVNGGRFKKAKGFGTGVTLKIKTKYQSGSVCISFAGSTVPGCKSLQDVCGSDECSYRMETRAPWSLFGPSEPKCCVGGTTVIL